MYRQRQNHLKTRTEKDVTLLIHFQSLLNGGHACTTLDKSIGKIEINYLIYTLLKSVKLKRVTSSLISAALIAAFNSSSLTLRSN